MNMVNLGYWIATLLIAMIVVVRGYPVVRQLRAEGKFSAGRVRRVAARGASRLFRARSSWAARTAAIRVATK
jgi:hypothetical protein